jgi:hypothetical protein
MRSRILTDAVYEPADASPLADSAIANFKNSPIHQFTNSPIHQFTNSPIHQFTNDVVMPVL